MDFIMGLGDVKIIVDIIKICFINMCTYYMNFKLINRKIDVKCKNIIIVCVSVIIVSLISKAMKEVFGFSYALICMISLVGLIFYKTSENEFVYSLIITIVSLSINYIIFAMSIPVSFIINIIINIENDYINIVIMIVIYLFLLYSFLRIKRFRKGIIFLNRKLKNESFEMLILNIGVIILFYITILSNYNIISSKRFGAGFIVISIMMFLTIQKSLQLYYKQKLLMQDLEETKKELENKTKEVEELEKENLSFSKKSHSIAHKQRALEHKLNELMAQSEIAEEIDIRDKVEKLSKEISNEKVTIELSKTGIEEIDDMLKYMQSECINNNIEFELKLSGNIHQMINNYVSKENLEILIADHIKNAIIAIQNSDNTNKSILVRLGKIEGFYGLYIYDSGIEFEKETLEKLGKEPSTTHADNGGTGMGFMNTFDTLNKYKASMIIKEIGKPSKDNYTKIIMIKFDNKNDFIIDSYRK